MERGDNLLYFVVEAAGFANMAGSRPLPSATTGIELELRMPRGVAVRVRVVGREGHPIPAARVYWVHPPTEGSPIETSPSEGRPSESGWIDLPRVLPGQRPLAIEATNDERYEHKVQVIDVRPADVETTLVLERVEGVVAGRVFRPPGHRWKAERSRWTSRARSATGRTDRRPS